MLSKYLNDEYKGKIFGKLTAIEPTGEETSDQGPKWRFKCKCGNTVERFLSTVILSMKKYPHRVPCCKDCRVDRDITGKKFGKLTVLVRTSLRAADGRSSNRLFICECDCGEIILINGGNLVTGNTISCGCEHRKVVKEVSSTHSMSKDRIYKIWAGIKVRCYNNKCESYFRYGGRGIKVCDEWKDDFMNFYNWAMNNGYKDDLTIDRIDVNGNYEPDNCKWIPLCEQSWNKRNTRKYIDGRPLSVVCNEVGIDLNLVHQRIDRDKMSIYDAVNKPIRGKH